MNVPIRAIRPSVLYFGQPVALLSTLNADGSSNLSPISSCWALGQRLVQGIGLDGQAWANLQRDPGLVLNLPEAAQWRAVERLGRLTGVAEVPAYKVAMGYRHCADKFAAAGLQPLASEQVRAARVRECPAQLEARALLPEGQALELALQQARERGFLIIEAEVLQVHAHERICVPGSEHIDTSAWQPLLYVFRHYCGTGAPLGANFRAETAIPQETCPI